MKLDEEKLNNGKLIFGGILFLCLGLAFLGKSALMLKWREQKAVVEKVEVTEERRDTGNVYQVNVSYRWEEGGKPRISNRISTDHAPTEDRAKAEAEAARWPLGATVRCWVNPDSPYEAVLDRWGGSEIGWVFLVSGILCLAWVFWWPRWVAKPWRWRVGERPPFPREGWGWALGFLICAAFLTGFVVAEIAAHRRVADWRETPCVILESRVLLNSSNEFQPLVRYQWEAGDAVFESIKVNCSELQGGVLEVERTVAAHPAGQRTVCRVNPQNPSEAVLDAEYRPRGIFFWIAGLLITVAVGAGLRGCWKRWRLACGGYGTPQETTTGSGDASGFSVDSLDLSKEARPPVAPADWSVRVGSWLGSSLANPRGALLACLASWLLLWAILPTVLREWHYGLYMTVSQYLVFGVGIFVLATPVLLYKALKRKSSR